MSAFLVLDAVSARTPDRRVLFSELFLSVSAERVGVVGRNGAGKSTLLRIASGAPAPASGSVRRSGTVAALAQNWPETASLAEALGVAEPLAAIRRVLDGAAPLDDPDWSLPARVDAALAEAGPSGLDPERPIGTLSGGERMRVAIAGLRLAAPDLLLPDLLLLDEPTNNLDAAGREAIASLLRAHRGGMLLASHDRALLDGMDRIVALAPTGIRIRIVGGGWSAFAAVRAAERAGAAQASERAEAALSQAWRTAQAQREARERRDRAGRAEAARGSVPAIALGRRAERAQNSTGRVRRLGDSKVAVANAEAAQARAGVELVVPFNLLLPPCLVPPGHAVLDMRDAAVRRGGRRLGPWTLSLQAAARVAVTGATAPARARCCTSPRGCCSRTLAACAGTGLPCWTSTQRCRMQRLRFWPTCSGCIRYSSSGKRGQAAPGSASATAMRNDACEACPAASGSGRRCCACWAAPRCRGCCCWTSPPTISTSTRSRCWRRPCAGSTALLVASHDAAFLRAIGVRERYAVGTDAAQGN